ncbi:hypothetical protein NDU88_005632 [Pleurodeles waltl]|uniref:Basic proline-rich protein-like n=1 Tax=Pleurodeles waltl TaxID=8319 RepID=A0AAV7TBN6_PLEWA|nr:hypothetical protein NDU88_005632 [Pleurodeles waltl]
MGLHQGPAPSSSVHLGRRPAYSPRGPIVPPSRGPTQRSPRTSETRGGKGAPSPPPQLTGGPTLAPWAPDGLPRSRKVEATCRLFGLRPPDPVPPQPAAAAGTRPAVAPSRALVVSMPCLHPRGRSAQPEPPAATSADRERGPGLERLPSGGPPGLRTPVRPLFRAPESS